MIDSSRQHALNRWYWRIPLKWLVFGGVTFFVLFPNPAMFARHVSHLLNLDAMIKPDAPELMAWEAEFNAHLRKRMTANRLATPGRQTQIHEMDASEIQRAIQAFTYRKVQYGWDWDVWGAADYMPTVAEMFHQAKLATDRQMREDCDGRAVMAASFMRRLGYKASIVTDLRHVWVITPEGEWMGPGRKKTIRSTPDGNRTAIAGTLSNVPVALSYGLAVFPFWREFLILATAFVLMLHRGLSLRWAGLAALLMFQGLLFMRLGYLAPRQLSDRVAAWPACLGAFHVSIGAGILLWNTHRLRRPRRSRF